MELNKPNTPTKTSTSTKQIHPIEREGLTLTEIHVAAFFDKEQINKFTNFFPPKFGLAPPKLEEIISWMIHETRGEMNILNWNFEGVWNYINNNSTTEEQSYMLRVSQVYYRYKWADVWIELMNNINSYSSEYHAKLVVLLTEVCGIQTYSYINGKNFGGIETCIDMLKILINNYSLSKRARKIVRGVKSLLLTIGSKYSDEEIIANKWWKLSYMKANLTMSNDNDYLSLDEKEYLAMMKF